MSLKRYWRKIIASIASWLIAEDPNMDGTDIDRWNGKTEPQGDSVSFSELDFCWGGFTPDTSAQIKAYIGNLSIGATRMWYEWMQGGCERLGAKSATDADCIACLFCLIGGKWKGGKFDWISTSRTTRDFANIRSGYNGWDKDALAKADAYAFVILSKDGKSRTNIIRGIK